MRYDRAILTLAALALLMSTAGCAVAGLRQAMGLEKTPPDEFQVMARAPLSMPPDFNLRPPEPGAPRPQEMAPRDQAQTLVFGSGGGEVAYTGDVSPGEAALLQQAGATNVDPAIRQMVNRETDEEIAADSEFVDRLVFWREPAPPGQVVDPVAEQQRLQENAALGKPITEGETPVVIRRKKALLEGIF
jgi:hypothetical protein